MCFGFGDFVTIPGLAILLLGFDEVVNAHRVFFHHFLNHFLSGGVEFG